MFKQKRFWILILCVLVIAIGCVLFYGRKAPQAPVKVYKVVEVEHSARPKPPPLGETTDSGHWHGDDWHAQPHVSVVETDVAMETYGDEELAAYEASLAHFTEEERATYSRALRGEIVRHREKYPDCQDHEAVFEDADRVSRWYVSHKKWRAESEKRSKEWETVMFENDELYEKLRFNMSKKERRQYIENMSEAERSAITTRLETWKERKDAAYKNLLEVRREEPIEPKRRHTH